VVQKGRVFKKEEDLSVWVTDDGNHLPILVQAKILVGSIKMEMVSYQGLANPISKQ
jgi:murein L,D-transpeptidase YafK